MPYGRGHPGEIGRLGLQRAWITARGPVRDWPNHHEPVRLLWVMGRRHHLQVRSVSFHINSTTLIASWKYFNLALPITSLVWTRMLCATVENGVDSCNGEELFCIFFQRCNAFGCENVPHSQAHIHFWTSNFIVALPALTFLLLLFVCRWLRYRSDYSCACYEVLLSPSLAFMQKENIAANEEGKKFLPVRFRKFSQLLNKNLFTATYNTENEKFPSWLTFTFLTLTIQPALSSSFFSFQAVQCSKDACRSELSRLAAPSAASPSHRSLHASKIPQSEGS